MYEKEAMIQQFKYLVNEKLPYTYTKPVRLNHCFNRIILDWLFKDCWYAHLNKKQTALSQLSLPQLKLSVSRMNDWLMNHDLLVEDNSASLQYRKKYRLLKSEL